MVSELVKRLSNGKHAIILEERNDSYADIKKRIENGFVHVKFNKTNGNGTEIGIDLDTRKTIHNNAEFDIMKGLIHIEGETNLNGSQVRCIADIDLATKSGEAYLVVI
jgi:hypothetical protein